jgi:3-oxoadipate enol-lactonase
VEAFVNGLKLFYTDSGHPSAPAVVFIHGFPFDHTLWQEQAVLLQTTFRVITYDQRGHGQTGLGEGPYTFEALVDDLFGLLDALSVRQAILCGLSMGGYAALRAAERAPERVQGLILCDTQSEADSNEAKLKRAAAIRTIHERGVPAFAEGFLKVLFAPDSFTEKPKTVDKVRRVIQRNPIQGICGTQVALATRTDTTLSLARLNTSTLILVGEQDAITPPAAAERLHERIAGSELAIIPGAGHLSNLENPAVFNQHLTRFLERFSR